MTPVEITALPVGVVIATLATAVGIGGGILWTPYLIVVVGLGPSEAVLTSLLIQVAGMGSGAYSSIRRGRVSLSVAVALALAGIPGIAVGVWLGQAVNQESVVFILGGASLATAMVFAFAREEYSFTPHETVELKALARYLWAPPLLSVLTGLLSIGVGDFLVPLLRSRLGMKMESAIGVCLAVMSVNAAMAAGLRLWSGDWFPPRLVFFAVIGVIVGGQIGPRLAGRLPDQTLKELFIYGLSLVGIHLTFNAW